MYRASATWKQQFQFEGKGNGGIPVAMDGDGKTGNSPTDLILVGLCACTGYDVVSILQKKRQPLKGLEISAEAEKAPHSPRVYTAIKLLYRISGKVSRKAAEDAVRLSEEKYCSVSAMLSKTARVTYEIQMEPQ